MKYNITKYMKLISHNEDQTKKIGEHIARTIQPGAIILLDGNLGSGKTMFTKGLAAGFNIKANVNSPTFTIMKVYPVRRIKGVRHFCHIDAYRIENEAQADTIGIEEFLNDPHCISVIEWPKNIAKKLKKYNDQTVTIKITPSKKDHHIRFITITAQKNR